MLKNLSKEELKVIIILAILYFLSGKLSFFLSVESSIVTISIFFAEGVSLAAVLIYGKKVWPGIFIGQLILALSTDLSFFPSVLISGINSLEAVFAYYLFKYFKFDISLRKIHHLYLLFFLIIFILQPFSAILGNLVLMIFSVIEPSVYFANVFSWWFGNSLGQLLIVPILLLVYYELKNIDFKHVVFAIVIGVLVSYAILILFPVNNLALLLSITILLSILVTIEWGLVYASFVILIITIMSLLSLYYNVGSFTTEVRLDNIININFYILAHILVVYTIGILLIERDNAIKDMMVLNLSLEEKVDEEVEKNRQQQFILQEQSRHAQMGEMISMIAHQWRQPLNNLSLIIQGASLKYKLGKFDDTQMLKLSQDSKNQISQMSQTIDDFRYFFKPDKDAKEFSVNAVILHTLTLLKPALDQEDIVVETYLEEEILIKGFSNELGQVLITILNNAKDALVENNSAKKKRITILLKKDNDKAVISIEDNAGGIADDVIDQIYNPYFSTKEEKNGTGLGLYMSKSIIEGHSNGILSVENSSNGAVFKIILGGR